MQLQLPGLKSGVSWLISWRNENGGWQYNDRAEPSKQLKQ
jgi:hypothetical protein